VYRFLLSSRWIGFAVFVIVLAAVCTRLGFWQLNKLELRLDRNDVITAHFSEEPRSLDAALPPGATVDKSTEWTRVTATGTYDLDHQLTVKFTTRDGAPGADVITPLVLADGTGLLVNRGWIGTDNNMAQPVVPPPPTGEVTIMGWLRQNSGAGDNAVRPNDGQIRAISSTALIDFVPYELTDGYVNLQEQTPASATPLAAQPEPELGQGPHFFYALQWWFFTLLAIIGYFWFARAEAKERRNPRRIDGFTTDRPAGQPQPTR
jgi:cytochrome oxidase assembly protein ShyY1